MLTLLEFVWYFLPVPPKYLDLTDTSSPAESSRLLPSTRARVIEKEQKIFLQHAPVVDRSIQMILQFGSRELFSRRALATMYAQPVFARRCVSYLQVFGCQEFSQP